MLPTLKLNSWRFSLWTWLTPSQDSASVVLLFHSRLPSCQECWEHSSQTPITLCFKKLNVAKHYGCKRALEALWSNCKQTQSSESRLFLCKKLWSCFARWAASTPSSETQGQIVGRAGNWGERKRRRRGRGRGEKSSGGNFPLLSGLVPRSNGVYRHLIRIMLLFPSWKSTFSQSS